jgi:hypothetical protein
LDDVEEVEYDEEETVDQKPCENGIDEPPVLSDDISTQVRSSKP